MRRPLCRAVFSPERRRAATRRDRHVGIRGPSGGGWVGNKEPASTEAAGRVPPHGRIRLLLLQPQYVRFPTTVGATEAGLSDCGAKAIGAAVSGTDCSTARGMPSQCSHLDPGIAIDSRLPLIEAAAAKKTAFGGDDFPCGGVLGPQGRSGNHSGAVNRGGERWRCRRVRPLPMPRTHGEQLSLFGYPLAHGRFWWRSCFGWPADRFPCTLA